LGKAESSNTSTTKKKKRKKEKEKKKFTNFTKKALKQASGRARHAHLRLFHLIETARDSRCTGKNCTI
jgi:hypothetical protein